MAASAVMWALATMVCGAQASMRVEAFPLQSVRLLDGPCKDAQEANRKYLLALDADRLLWAFRQNAGLATPGEPLGGWEKPDCEVRGHFVGHYLSACALMYASTGDEALRDRGKYMVAEMAKCQQALGNGYLSAYPATFWDRLESMQTPPWAPYYTMHKIMAGLYDQYTLCGNQQALDVLKGMASYFKGRHDKLSIWQWDRTLDIEFGGMAEVLYNLYAVTNDPAHRDLAHAFDKATFLGPLSLEHDNLSKIHANTHIPEVVGAARRYEVLGDERYRTAAEFFWKCVVDARTYATGGTSDGEIWPEPNRLAGTVSERDQESCTSYNMLRLTRHLFQWSGDPRYADYYERTYLNSILGTQRASDGMLIYFTPLAPGLKKTFGTPNDSFWCCYGTGIESFAKLGDSVYFHDADSVWVNLFVPSEVTWEQKGVRLEQSTRFPDEPKTSLTVHAASPTRFGLKLRVPAWAEGATIRVNGTESVAATPGAYAAIDREWREGDRVEEEFPMRLQAVPLPDDPETVAVMYGPVVLAGLTETPVHIMGDPKEPGAWLKPVEGKGVTFETTGQAVPMRFVPLDRVVDEAYGVYFVVTPEGSPRHQQLLAVEEEQRRFDARVVDKVVVGNEAIEKAHNLQGEKTQAGTHLGKGWRHAPDGWFSWDLKVLPDQPVVLGCLYWGDDVPPRTFDIIVDGRKIATQSLNRDRPGEFFRVEYAVPEDVTRGKERVTVRFQAGPGCIAGGVFECAVLRGGK